MFGDGRSASRAPCQTLGMALVHVQVERDHVEKLTRPSRRFAGISELIWNGLDAEATKVTVSIAENALGGADQVIVTDNGHGMTNAEAHRYFATLGGSWKRTAPGRHSKSKKRVLHGSEGQGRWRAFGVGTFVTWRTVAEVDGGREHTRIIGTLENLTDFHISEPEATEDTPGTRVEIENIRPESQGLLGERVHEALTAEFALYLEKYSVTVAYRGTMLDPAAVQERRDELAVEYPNPLGPLSATVIEWKREFPRSLLLCDQDEVVLGEIAPGVQAPGFDFTVYVKWEGFRRFESELLLAELGNPNLSPAIEAVRDSLRTHFRGRMKEKTAELIEDWKREQVYPYSGDAASPVEAVERELFEVVAVAAASAVNAASDRPSRRLSLRLLREAIERAPGSLHLVLQEVMDLPAERLDELAKLLDRTALADIVAAANVVTNRLDFLTGLEVLLFESENKKALLERRQLHRILAAESWVFGDEYVLAVDDESLTQVLTKHLRLLGRSALAPPVEEKVLTEEGVHGIVDLMLSKAVELPRHREHLVIELKRPSVKIGSDEITQIEKYAFAVAADERFANTRTRWEFWIVSNELTEYAIRRSTQQPLPAGVIHQEDNITIFARTWGQIIEDCRRRLMFVQDNLNYRSTRDHAIDYLRATHARYLPDSV